MRQKNKNCQKQFLSAVNPHIKTKLLFYSSFMEMYGNSRR